MRRGLRLRLALTHGVVAVLAIVVVALIVNVAGGRRFDSYLSQVQHVRNQAVVRTLVSSYQAPDGWNASAIFALSSVATLNNVDVAVYSPDGKLLFTVQGRGGGMMNSSNSSGGGMMGGGMMGTGGDNSGSGGSSGSAPLSRSQFDMRSYPVVVSGRTVATADVYTPRDLRAAAESAYQSSLTRNLLIAGLAAAGLAFLVSLLVSRRITAPLEELTEAAQDVADGNLAVRVTPRAQDEVGALAGAFNGMTERLARNEQWRRDMTADLSHELRTPLATIQSRVEALQDGVLPATPENLQVIGAEVERLGRLLGALRSLNDLESNEMGLRCEPLDLADVARDAVDRVATASAGKGVELAGDLQPAVVRADRDRLLQVTGNLLDNALKFTPEGGRVVLAVASGDSQPGAAPGDGRRGAADQRVWASLRVADSGPGVDAADQPFIFGRFYRAATARGTQGAGLGLAIARGLVEAQGGTIAVANGMHGGAVFTVRLPAED
jgi:signal transduction histidine kinase